MHRTIRWMVAAVVLVGAWLALGTWVEFAQAQDSPLSATVHAGNYRNPRVFAPNAAPYGKTYGEWSAAWWQWAYGLPVEGHPLFDETGADCANGQSGPVWFLGGVFNVTATATRDLCVVPAGKALFFPIINNEFDNVCPPFDPPLTAEELAAAAAAAMNTVTDVQCEVDGRSILNLEAYRCTAGPFGIHIPEGNIWQAFGCTAPAGDYAPLMADGIFVMLAPLPPGAHTIHFTGTLGDPYFFTLDITYHLTVATPEGSLAGSTIGTGAPGTIELTGGDRVPSSWGQLKASYR